MSGLVSDVEDGHLRTRSKYKSYRHVKTGNEDYKILYQEDNKNNPGI